MSETDLTDQLPLPTLAERSQVTPTSTQLGNPPRYKPHFSKAFLPHLKTRKTVQGKGHMRVSWSVRLEVTSEERQKLSGDVRAEGDGGRGRVVDRVKG